MRAQECLKPFKGRFEKIFDTFVRNGYCMHPEGMLLAGITCKDKAIALRALAIHEKALKYHEDKTEIRKYVKPGESQYNLAAEHWFDALDWPNLSDEYITPSPLIKGLYPDVEKLRHMINQNEEIPLPPNLVAHARNNERAVKQTTMSVGGNRTHQQQMANIISAGTSRKLFPLNGPVADFLPKD